MKEPAGGPADTPWRWRHLRLAPHRLGFFLAMVVLLASGLWWAGVQLQRSGAGPGLPYAVPPSLVHATVMTFGFMPLFFSGFLFTAAPKWLRVPGPSAARLQPLLLAQAAGWLAWLAGSHVHAAIAAAGLSLVLVGFGGVVVRFWRMLAASREADRLHPLTVGAAFVVGWLSLLGVALSVLLGADQVARLFALTGLWGFVVVVFVTVAHRMIPFFTAGAVPKLEAWRPSWVLGLMVTAAAVEGSSVWMDAALPSFAPWQLLRGAFDVGAGAFLLWLALMWGLVKSLKIRLLAMLHLGFVWLGLGFFFSGAAQLVALAADAPVLPLAPLHAVAMGCLGSLMLSMVSRVTCGHSGRPVVADNLVWTLFWLLQAATLIRIAATLPKLPTQALLTTAALLWACVAGAWGLRYGSWYGRARADGRPG